MEKVLDEARLLAAEGTRELIVIAQDITRYGLDSVGRQLLPELLRELGKIEGIEWIRLHYLYPHDLTDELIDTIAAEPKVLKYLDIPIQHIDDGILKRMNRRGDGAEVRALFKKLRQRIPGLVLRTSLITGLPGEGEAEFEELCDFLREAKIERAGTFPYSPEEGTPAADMPRPSRETAEHRAELIDELQSRIMDEFNDSRVGKTYRVLCEGFDRLAECWYGRSWAESPDIDGKIFYTGGSARPGELLTVLMTGTLEGDMLGEAVEDGQ